MEMPRISQEQIMETLGIAYEKALAGVPTQKNCQDLANEYLTRYEDPRIAAKKFISNQVLICATDGFITSLGGIITIPVTLPVNLTTVWYVQLRMIATIATLAGYDPSDDEVQTLAYICLAGSSASKLCREAGVQFGNKLAISTLKKLPGTLLTKINQKVGFRFLTKFGSKGVVNLVKLVPLVGGAVGGGLDFAGTKLIAARAMKVFFDNDLD